MPTLEERDLERLPELATELVATVEELELRVDHQDYSAHTRDLAQRARTSLAQMNVILDQLGDEPVLEQFLAIAATVQARLDPLLTRLREAPVLH